MNFEAVRGGAALIFELLIALMMVVQIGTCLWSRASLHLHLLIAVIVQALVVVALAGLSTWDTGLFWAIVVLNALVIVWNVAIVRDGNRARQQAHAALRAYLDRQGGER